MPTDPLAGSTPHPADPLAGAVPSDTGITKAAKFGLHALPWATAALGPEGIAASAVVQGIAGISEEFGVQTIDRIRGRRAEYDWHAIAWNGGWTGAFGGFGATLGKLAGEAVEAGESAIHWPEVQQIIERGGAVTPKVVRGIAQGASDELTSKTMIDTLGLHLGMTEEQSGKMINAYDEGKQVRDSFGKADEMLQGEFNKRYDKILNKYYKTPVNGAPLGTSIEEIQTWLQKTGNASYVRPTITSKLEEIHDAVTGTVKVGGQSIPGAATGAKPADVSSLRGWINDLRNLQRTTNLSETERDIVGRTERALNNTLVDTLKKVVPGPARYASNAVAEVAKVDNDYDVFESNFGTFWKALKDKKSLSEVGDAIYDQLGQRPDALRYMLNAADRAGRMDDMRMAFLNKVYRGAQFRGNALARANAIREYIGPGTQGLGTLQMVMGKRPGVTDSVMQFAQRLEDMNAAQKVLKAPEMAGRINRILQSRIVYATFVAGVGGGMYGAVSKDPGRALLVFMGLFAGAAGLSKAATSPMLNRLWVEWVQTNPRAPEFIIRGVKLMSQATKEGIVGKPREILQQTNTPASAPR